MAIVKVPVSKTGTTLDVDIDAIPANAFSIIVMEGLKAVLAKKMSKITVAKLEGEELAAAQAAALKIAEANLADVMADNIKSGRSAKKSTVKGVVMTEARRLAKAVVKDQIRASGQKISHFKASEITEAANALIEADPSYITMAEANLAARESAPKPTIDITALIKPDAELVKKAEAKKAEGKGQLSAKQAGKVAPRKGGPKPGKETGASA